MLYKTHYNYLLFLLVGCIFLDDLFAKEVSSEGMDWLDQDKKVFVLQKKLYSKKNTYYTDINYINGTGDDFIDRHGFNVNLGYYPLEDLGVSIGVMDYSSNQNESYRTIKYLNGSVPFIREFTRSYSLNLIYSPVYGKINTFNQIFYFTTSFIVGASYIQAQSNLASVSDPDQDDVYKKESFVGINAGVKFNFHLTEFFAINWEILNTAYQEKTPTSNEQSVFQSNQDFVLGVSLSF